MNTYVTGTPIRQLREKRNMTHTEPVEKIGFSSKAYNRNKARNWKREYHGPVPGFLQYIEMSTAACNGNIRFVERRNRTVSLQTSPEKLRFTWSPATAPSFLSVPE